MSVIKTRCPDCDANIRHSVEPDNQSAKVAVTCPRCGLQFKAPAEPADPSPAPKKAAPKPAARAAVAARPVKAVTRRDADDDDDDAPKAKKGKKKKAAAAGPNTKLLAGGVGGGVLLIGGIVAAVLGLGGKKDKPTDVAKSDPPAQVQPEPQPRPQPKQNSGTGASQNPAPNPPQPGDLGGLLSGLGVGAPAPKKDKPSLPPPPVIRVNSSVAPAGTIDPVEKPPPTPPLTPDEDPFELAKKFHPEGKLPKLPNLPPVNQRPLLALDPGGHSAFVHNVFITPDGKRVITVGEDKAVRIWDATKGAVLRTVRLPAGVGDEGSLKAAALAPNGKTLAVGGTPIKGTGRNQVPVFQIDTDRGTVTPSTITTALDEVLCMDYSGDGKHLAVGCLGGGVQLFDAKTRAVVFSKPDAHAVGVLQLRFNPGARILATIGLEGSVRAWNLDTKGGGAIDASALQPRAIAWSNDGQFLAVGGGTGEIGIYNLTGQKVRVLPKKVVEGVTVPVRSIRFLPGDQELVVSGSGGGPKIGWAGIVSAQTGATRVEFRENSNVVWAVNVSADGERVVSSGGNENEIYVWSAKDGKSISRLCGAGKGVWGIGWARDGKSIAWGHQSDRDADGIRPLVGAFRMDEFAVAGRINPAGYQQAVRKDGDIELEVLPGDRILGVIIRGGKAIGVQVPSKIFAATLLPGRGLVAVATASGVSVFEANNPRSQKEYTAHTGNVLSIAPSPDGKYFVTGSTDQTMRIWMPEFDEPVLSVFVAGREWIAWTAFGFYACSPHGEQLLAWQVNNTAYRAPTVHPASRFRASLYQPALLKYLIPTGSIPMAMAMAKKHDKALVESRTVSDVMPPEITFPDLTDDAVVVDQDTFVVKAVAKGKQPITAMRLLVDGRPFQGAAGVRKFAKAEPTAEASWEVPLTPGAHSFAVVADTPVSKGMSKVALLTRSGTPPKPNLYVLAVGVSDYPDKDMRLRYAASDARMLAKAFQEKSTGVFGNIEVRVLTDADATTKKMRDGLDWMSGKMTAKDVGVVMFSGHGTRDPLFGRFYLVTHDVDERDMAGTCFSGEEFKTRLENMPGRLVAILDACHSGAVAEKVRPPVQTDGLIRDLVSEDAGVVVMCSSLGREFSIESSLTEAGFYTLALVEGLSGHGDVDQDGLIYIHELDMYTAARVAQLSGGEQTPTTGRPPAIRPFPIAGAPKEKEPDKEKEKEKEKQPDKDADKGKTP